MILRKKIKNKNSKKQINKMILIDVKLIIAYVMHILKIIFACNVVALIIKIHILKKHVQIVKKNLNV